MSGTENIKTLLIKFMSTFSLFFTICKKLIKRDVGSSIDRDTKKLYPDNNIKGVPKSRIPVPKID